ncbi:hypothetical protein B0H14DRAFT_3526020 [Mycena olivaceomarginata]|nr:hypothetical protein B0H14DRAFT_3526020 [Mycena olivaceomarginata]
MSGLIFDGHTAVFSKATTEDMRNIMQWGHDSRTSRGATWFFAGSLEDKMLISSWYRADLRVVTQDFIFEMANNDGRFQPEGAIVSAADVFDLNNAAPGLVFRELTPPSPFTPRPRTRRAEQDILKRKRDVAGPAQDSGPEIIDLTLMSDDEGEMEDVLEALRLKVEPQENLAGNEVKIVDKDGIGWIVMMVGKNADGTFGRQKTELQT